MKFLYLVLLNIFVATTVFAKEIVFINPSSPTGNHGIYASEIVKDINKTSDYNVELITTNLNCALAKNLWNKSDRPTIMITGTIVEPTTDKTNEICFIETNKNNLLYVLTKSTVSFCSAGNKTWEDFKNSKSIHVVNTMTSLDMENFIKRLAKTYNSNIRVVRVVTYNETLTMMKANEIDFIFRAGLSATPELTDKCFWNTSNVPIKNDEKESYDYLEPKVFLIAKGFNNIDLQKIRSQIREIMANNNEIKKQVERRGQLVFDWDSKDEFNLILMNFLNDLK